MAQAWRDWLIGAWDEWRVEVDGYRELDDQRVLMLVDYSARGKTSGLELGQVRTRSAGLFRVCGGKVTKLVVCWSWNR